VAPANRDKEKWLNRQEAELKFERGMPVKIKGLKVLGTHSNGEIICAYEENGNTVQILVHPKSLLQWAGR
jgi:hypothetical protein